MICIFVSRHIVDSFFGMDKRLPFLVKKLQFISSELSSVERNDGK